MGELVEIKWDEAAIYNSLSPLIRWPNCGAKLGVRIVSQSLRGGSTSEVVKLFALGRARFEPFSSRGIGNVALSGVVWKRAPTVNRRAAYEGVSELGG